MEHLKAAGIGSQVHYIPVHLQPYYRQRYGALDLPGAERYYARTLSLPLYAAMNEGDVDRVVEALRAALRRNCRRRSEERRVGKECGRTGRSRGSPYH